MRTSALMFAGVNHALAPADSDSGASNSALFVCDYKMFVVVVLHQTLVPRVARGCLSFE